MSRASHREGEVKCCQPLRSGVATKPIDVLHQLTELLNCDNVNEAWLAGITQLLCMA